jgi:hypothetical protein
MMTSRREGGRVVIVMHMEDKGDMVVGMVICGWCLGHGLSSWTALRRTTNF